MTPPESHIPPHKATPSIKKGESMLPPPWSWLDFTTAQWGQCSGSDPAWLLRPWIKDHLCPLAIEPWGLFACKLNCRKQACGEETQIAHTQEQTGKCRDLLKRGVQSALTDPTLSYSPSNQNQSQKPFLNPGPQSLWERTDGSSDPEGKGHLASREKHPETKW